jgi:Zn finger protein HypA/HybF involved in hydrogenase expression
MTNQEQKFKPKMVLHCHKCGHERDTELEYPDNGRCPKCGRHGYITLDNSMGIRNARMTVVKFVPVR